jgi:hypothetical protein
VSPRAHELDETDTITLPNALDFAGFATVDVEIVDVHRHAAEKLHGMLKDFGENKGGHRRAIGASGADARAETFGVVTERRACWNGASS